MPVVLVNSEPFGLILRQPVGDRADGIGEFDDRREKLGGTLKGCVEGFIFLVPQAVTTLTDKGSDIARAHPPLNNCGCKVGDDLLLNLLEGCAVLEVIKAQVLDLRGNAEALRGTSGESCHRFTRTNVVDEVLVVVANVAMGVGSVRGEVVHRTGEHPKDEVVDGWRFTPVAVYFVQACPEEVAKTVGHEFVEFCVPIGGSFEEDLPSNVGETMAGGLEEHLAHLRPKECRIIAFCEQLRECLLAGGRHEELRVGLDDGEEQRVLDSELLLDDRGFICDEDAVGEFLVEQPISSTCRALVSAVDEVLALTVSEQAVFDAELIAFYPQKHDALGNVNLDAIAIFPYAIVPEEDPLSFKASAQVPGDLIAHS